MKECTEYGKDCHFACGSQSEAMCQVNTKGIFPSKNLVSHCIVGKTQMDDACKLRIITICDGICMSEEKLWS